MPTLESFNSLEVLELLSILLKKLEEKLEYKMLALIGKFLALM
jgi:hypothetical protein